MKKLFAILASLVVSAFAFTAKAQLSDIEGMPPYKLGVTVGLNMPWMSGNPSSVSGFLPTSYKMNTGFQIGANLMVDASDLLPNTFGRVELKYSLKGAKATHSGIKEDISIHYIEIPVHYGYAWFINDDLSLMAETGPYIALGLSGKDDMSAPQVGIVSSPDVFGTRFDLGWGVQASAMIAKNYQVHVGYDFGFINVNKYFLQNRNLSIGLTWFFESLFE